MDIALFARQRAARWIDELTVSITSARKKAREITEGCVYGSLELLGVEKEG